MCSQKERNTWWFYFSPGPSPGQSLCAPRWLLRSTTSTRAKFQVLRLFIFSAQFSSTTPAERSSYFLTKSFLLAFWSLQVPELTSDSASSPKLVLEGYGLDFHSQLIVFETIGSWKGLKTSPEMFWRRPRHFQGVKPHRRSCFFAIYLSWDLSGAN